MWRSNLPHHVTIKPPRNEHETPFTKMTVGLWLGTNWYQNVVCVDFPSENYDETGMYSFLAQKVRGQNAVVY